MISDYLLLSICSQHALGREPAGSGDRNTVATTMTAMSGLLL